jgi:hypothetical protein
MGGWVWSWRGRIQPGWWDALPGLRCSGSNCLKRKAVRASIASVYFTYVSSCTYLVVHAYGVNIPCRYIATYLRMYLHYVDASITAHQLPLRTLQLLLKPGIHARNQRAGRGCQSTSLTTACLTYPWGLDGHQSQANGIDGSIVKLENNDNTRSPIFLGDI